MRASPERIEEILSYPTCIAEEAASVLGIGRGHAYQMIKNGELPAIHLGRRMLVKTAALRRMLDETHEATGYEPRARAS